MSYFFEKCIPLTKIFSNIYIILREYTHVCLCVTLEIRMTGFGFLFTKCTELTKIGKPPGLEVAESTIWDNFSLFQRQSFILNHKSPELITSFHQTPGLITHPHSLPSTCYHLFLHLFLPHSVILV